MELAKVDRRGQITIPIEIRKKPNIKEGDEVVFLEENGRIILENSAMLALQEVQDAFKDEAERLGLKDEQNIVKLVKEVRKKCGKKAMRITINTDSLISAKRIIF